MQSWHIAHGYEALTGERKPCWLEESGESMRLWPAFYSLLRSICQFYSLNQIACGLAMTGSFTGRSNSFLPKRLSDSEALLLSADRTSFISDRERGSLTNTRGNKATSLKTAEMANNPVKPPVLVS